VLSPCRLAAFQFQARLPSVSLWWRWNRSLSVGAQKKTSSARLLTTVKRKTGKIDVIIMTPLSDVKVPFSLFAIIDWRGFLALAGMM
jgi:hypothetical protein